VQGGVVACSSRGFSGLNFFRVRVIETTIGQRLRLYRRLIALYSLKKIAYGFGRRFRGYRPLENGFVSGYRFGDAVVGPERSGDT
jgi:hypothetical protein